MRLVDEEFYILPYEKAMDKNLIYFPLRGQVALIEREVAAQLEQGNEALFSESMDNHHMIELLQSIAVEPVKDLNRIQWGLPALNIDFSNGCNMRCIYCYACRGEGQITYQTKERINQIITIFFNYLQQHSQYKKKAVCPIVFSNDAEPTFSPELLIHTVTMIKEKAKEYEIIPQFSMPSNGVFNQFLTKFIIENFHSISLSFEGLPTVQNVHRPLMDGNPSYDLVYHNARLLYDSGIKIVFNIVVTAYNLELLKETVDYFDQKFPGVTISFSPVSLSGRAVVEQAVLKIRYDAFHIKLIEAVEYAKTKTIKLKDKNFQDYHQPRRHFCSSTAKPNWNVNLKGVIYACMESKDESMKIGFIDFKEDILKLDHKAIQTLQAYTVDGMDHCKDCFAKYLCAGGCKVRNECKAMECNEIRLKCLYLINQAYEEEQWFKKGQALFRINTNEEVKI